MERVDRIIRLAGLAAAAGCCIVTSTVAQSIRLKDYDVVAASSIARLGRAQWPLASVPVTSAFVFPSLAPDDQVTSSLDDVPLKVLTPNNGFHETKFTWRARDNAPDIVFQTARNGKGDTLAISIKPTQWTQIRRLTWAEFQELQQAFDRWLCAHSCWLFGDCEKRLAPDYRETLARFWITNVLSGTSASPPLGGSASIRDFADSYLNLTRAQPIQYVGQFTIPVRDTKMFATAIAPGQMLDVTWGGENFYPRKMFQQSYSRSTSSGTTTIPIVTVTGDDGVLSTQLYPVGADRIACAAESKYEAGTEGPYPTKLASLLGRNFMPIFNIFDLHNAGLLTEPPPAGTNCRTTPGARPSNIFLLAPASYVKADAGPTPDEIARFETDARFEISTSGGTPNPDDVTLFARQFVLLGCDKSDIASDVQVEWSRLLESVSNALRGTTDPVQPARCKPFVAGVFSGKSFVELRQHVSVNGHPVEGGVLNQTTIGQVLEASAGAHMNLDLDHGTVPIANLLRIPPPGNRLKATAIRMRFYTTALAVMDHVTAIEGDEIDVTSVSKTLR